jgi:hypothetical protein
MSFSLEERRQASDRTCRGGAGLAAIPSRRVLPASDAGWPASMRLDNARYKRHAASSRRTMDDAIGAALAGGRHLPCVCSRSRRNLRCRREADCIRTRTRDVGADSFSSSSSGGGDGQHMAPRHNVSVNDRADEEFLGAFESWQFGVIATTGWLPSPCASASPCVRQSICLRSRRIN